MTENYKDLSAEVIKSRSVRELIGNTYDLARMPVSTDAETNSLIQTQILRCLIEISHKLFGEENI